jgi:uncharacterized protein (TIGR03083 family)
VQTVSPAWTVKDVAAHLLDTQLRRLSMGRDRYFAGPPPVIESNDDLIRLIDRLNREGVEMYRRFSPAVLIAMMEVASHEVAAYVQSLDPMADAPIGVSWAGEEKSANWFDTARELTERWHHQQQIRLATDRPGIMTRELYFPVLDTFMRALPFVFRDLTPNSGVYARFNVSGDCGGSWFLYGDEGRWELVETPKGHQIAETTIPQEIAWRIFTKGIDRESAEAQVSVTGDRTLGLHILRMVAIVG